MNTFSNKDGKVIVMNMISTVQKNKEYLSEIDGAIGDGDHGINMNKGFSLCEAQIKDKDIEFGDALIELGSTLFNEIGGSMGPIYGLLFMEMGSSLAGKDTIDTIAFYEMFDAGLTKLHEIISAKEGDKTLMDTLIPAIAAIKESIDMGYDFAVVLGDMKAAAAKGRDATRDMVAKLGRASRLGERSRGVVDAGAASCSLLLESMADSIIAIISPAIIRR